jgi:hypothetical protein
VATLSELRTLALQRADKENSRFISTTEANSYINLAYGELYDLLVSQFADYYSTIVSFTLSGTNTYALPADFYKIRGLDYLISAQNYVTVFPFNFNERNRFEVPVSRLVYGQQRRSYRIMGGNLILIPQQDVDGQYRMWYVPRYTRLANDSDVMGNVLDFEEYVVVGAAIMMLMKEESDCQQLVFIKDQLKNRIIEMAKERDASIGERVGDVTGWQTGYETFFQRF